MRHHHQWDVFLAHAGPDQATAEQLFELLEPRCKPFLSSRSLNLGDRWQQELAAAQTNSHYSVILISGNTDDAFYQQEEIAAAIDLARNSSQTHRVIPIYLEPDSEADPNGTPSPVPYGLRGLHGITLGPTVTLASAAERLLQQIAPPQPKSEPGHQQQPQQQPPPWNVPFRRNRFFIGRDDLLDNLASRDPGLTPIIALGGMGGVGKTELAVEYAYRQRPHVDVVWWVRAESPASLVADLADLAPKVGAGVDPTNVNRTARNAINWLNDTDRSWLLIFDNVEGPDTIDEWAPIRGNGQTVITSRYPTWGEAAEPVQVDTFDPEAAVRYLLNRTERKDVEGAARLAVGLDHLALALNQAAGYLNKNKHRTFDDYLQGLEADGLDAVPADGARHEHTIATLWKESFDQVRKHAPLAAELLELCALCGPEAIPLELFESPEPGAPGWPTVKVDEAVNELTTYSLAQTGADSTISIHRLVQLSVRNSLSPTDGHARLTLLYQLLDQRVPDDPTDPAAWDQIARLVDHVEHATASATTGHLFGTRHAAHSDEAEQLALAPNLLRRSRGYLASTGDYPSALRMSHQAVSLASKLLGVDHPVTLTAKHFAAEALRAMGESGKAKLLNDQVLAARRRIFGEDHPDTLRSLNNAARDLEIKGDAFAAIDLHRQVLATRREILGNEHRDTSTSMNNLAYSLSRSGQPKQAKQLLLEAIAARTLLLGADHPSTLIPMAHLADTHLRLGDFGAALELSEEVLDRRRRFLGDDHPLTLASVQARGGMLLAVGRIAEAQEVLLIAYNKRVDLLGRDHRRTLSCLDLLAEAYRQGGEFEKARDAFVEVVERRERVLGLSHRETLRSKANLALTLHQLGETAEAWEGYQAVVDEAVAAHGEEDSVTIELRELGPDFAE